MIDRVRLHLDIVLRYAGIAVGLVLFPAVMLGYLYGHRRLFSVLVTLGFVAAPFAWFGLGLTPHVSPFKREFAYVLFLGLALEYAAGAMARHALWADATVRSFGLASIAGVCLALAIFPVAQLKKDLVAGRSVIITRSDSPGEAMKTAFRHLIADAPNVAWTSVKERFIPPSLIAIVRQPAKAEPTTSAASAE